jgi:hypothetical protein
MDTTRRILGVLVLAGSMGACTIEMQSRSSPPPSGQPEAPPAPSGGTLRIALIPTRVSGVGEARAGAWNDAFREALADPRHEFPDPKDVAKTLEHHKKGRFNAFKDVTADVWIETAVFTQNETAYNKLTRKIEEAPRLRFTARVMKTLDDRGTTCGDGSRFFMNAAHAAQHQEVDLELVKKIAAEVRAQLPRS